MSTNRSRSSRRRASASRANSSSTWWSPTITRAIRSPARGAGGGSRSMCRRPARRCPATRPNRFRASNSGACATIRLSDIWRSNPAFNAFRGTDWMPELCRSCDRREIDWGGCRCQALALTGDARNTDPACHKSPHHERIAATAMAESESGDGGPLRWRSYKGQGRGVIPIAMIGTDHRHVIEARIARLWMGALSNALRPRRCAESLRLTQRVAGRPLPGRHKSGAA